MQQTLGARITFHRKRLGMTQDKLAEQLGVTAQAVSKWENDQSCPDITMLPKLADLFGITTDELLGRQHAEVVHQAEVVEEEGSLCIANVIAQWNVGFWSMAWPSFLLVFGIYSFIKDFNFFSCGCALAGAYFLVANLGIWHLNLGKELIFPIILVLFGLFLLADALRKPKKPQFRIVHRDGTKNGGKKMTCDYSADGEHFHYSLSFGESERVIALPRLSGGDISCSFGELEVDLSGCGEIADYCRINADCSFGELILKVPSKYRVEPSSDTAFGGFDIDGQPDANPAGLILLNASVSFGEICVEYI